LAYPAALLGISALAFLSLLYFVIPQFLEIIGTLGEEMGGAQVSGMTQVVGGIAAFASSVPGIILSVVVVVGPVVGLRAMRRTNRKAYDSLMSSIPFIGRLMLLGELSRVASMLRLMLLNGMTLREALGQCREAIANVYVRNALDAAIDSVENGRPMGPAFAKYDALPYEVSEMIGVGEEAGRLPDMLGHMERILRRRLNSSIDRAPVILQPVMLLVVGAMVVGLFVMFFFPYLDLLTNLSIADR